MTLLFVALSLLAQEIPLSQLAEALRADRVEDRAAAAKALKDRAPLSIPILQRAARDSDPEVALRSLEVLDTLSIETAPRDFQAFEDALEKARTVIATIQGEFTKQGGGDDDKSALEATVILADRDRAFIRESGQDADGSRYGFSVISDGSEVLKVLESGTSRYQWRMKAPKDLRRNLLAILIRDGSPGMMTAFLSGHKGVEEDPGIQTSYRLGDFKVVEWGELSNEMTYDLSYRRQSRSIEGRIRYESKSKVPTKRTRTITLDVIGYGKATIRTTENFTVNAEIPAEKFVIPEETR